MLAEVSYRLVIWSQAPRQPHRLDIAPSLALKPAARLDPIEIAINVEFQQDRRMRRRSAGHLGLDLSNPSPARSSSSTKTSITRLSSLIQSSRRSGNSVLCTRSVPSTKRLIRSPASRQGIVLRESLPTERFHTARVIRDWVETTADQAISGVPRLLPVLPMQPKKVMCHEKTSSFLPLLDVRQCAAVPPAGLWR